MNLPSILMIARDPPGDDTATQALRSLASSDLLELVGGFTLERVIGTGSTGRVLECIDTLSPPPQQGRRVVVKVLAPVLRTAAVLDRLCRQTVVLGGLHSHCLARVFEVRDHAGEPILVEELLLGEDLRTRLRRDGKMPSRLALRAVRDAARGLGAAFSVGVTHGDVKPANLFLFEGRVKLADFGLTADPGTRPTDTVALGRTLFTLLTATDLPPQAGAADVTEELLPEATPEVLALLRSMLTLDAALLGTYDNLVTRLEDTIAGRNAKERIQPPVALPVVGTAPPPTHPAAGASPAPLALRSSGAGVVSTSSISVREPSAGPRHAADAAAADPPSSSSTAGFLGAPTGVMGSLKQMSVIEIAQTLEMGRKTARVEVHPIDAAAGVFCCQGGRVVFAASGEDPVVGAVLKGEEAFFKLACHSDGFFRIHYGTESDESNIDAPTQYLLLETLRRLDERHLATVEVSLPTQQRSLLLTAPDSAIIESFTGAAAMKAALLDDFSHLPSTLPLGLAAAESASGSTLAGSTAPGRESAIHGLLSSARLIAHPWLSRAAVSARSLMVEARTQLLRRMPAAAPHLNRLQALVSERPWRLAAPAVLVVVVGVGGGMAFSSRFSLPEAIVLIDSGHAQEVVKDIDGAGPPPQQLARAHALASLGRDAEAFAAYEAAARGRVVDERALLWLLERLDSETPERAPELLQTWPDPTVQQRLVLRTAHPVERVRHNALTVLRERRELTNDDLERVAINDLGTSVLCSQRRAGLGILKEIGSSAAARLAIQDATFTKKGDNNCLAQELMPALKAVTSRSNPRWDERNDPRKP